MNANKKLKRRVLKVERNAEVSCIKLDKDMKTSNNIRSAQTCRPKTINDEEN
jgi:hypothetical protein